MSAKKDILIPVMGATGVGKSSFINAVLSEQKMEVGRGLKSCTSEVNLGYLETIEGYPSLKDYRIVLVDTPGLNDSQSEDIQILEKIAAWLRGSYTEGSKLGGVIYLHDITAARFDGAARRHLQIFRSLCGDGALDNVILATTKWGLKTQNSEDLETQLKKDYWSHLISQGAQVHRFDTSHESAWKLINAILSSGIKQGKLNQTILQIQQELLDPKATVLQTSAGKCVVGDSTLSPADILIPVMGATGAGKSFFINTLLKDQKMKVGRGLGSCTSEVDFSRVDMDVDAIKKYPALEGHQIVLVDTPGFDHTHASDLTILEGFATWLKDSYKKGAKLGGVIYLHDISGHGSSVTARQNFQTLRGLCGGGVLENIVLGTTKWVLNVPDSEIRRQQLVADHWKTFIDKGAQARRFDNSFDSAWSFIDALLCNREVKSFNKTVLQIQKELVYKEQVIPETQAGQELRSTLQEVLEIHKKLQRLNTDGDEELQAQRREAQEKVTHLASQLRELKIPLSRRLRRFFGF